MFMFNGIVRTAGLKVAKSAVIQMRGSGYDMAKTTSIKGGKSINFSANLNKPMFRSQISTHFHNMVPKRFTERISMDRDLTKLL